MAIAKTKITRSKFEEVLVRDFGVENLIASNYVEDGQKLTLYYLKNKYELPDGVVTDLHVGTWTKGFGWTFDHADKFRKTA